nr:hypothetical protein CFP56_13300 [Quercus suber]
MAEVALQRQQKHRHNQPDANGPADRIHELLLRSDGRQPQDEPGHAPFTQRQREHGQDVGGVETLLDTVHLGGTQVVHGLAQADTRRAQDHSFLDHRHHDARPQYDVVDPQLLPKLRTDRCSNDARGQRGDEAQRSRDDDPCPVVGRGHRGERRVVARRNRGHWEVSRRKTASHSRHVRLRCWSENRMLVKGLALLHGSTVRLKRTRTARRGKRDESTHWCEQYLTLMTSGSWSGSAWEERLRSATVRPIAMPRALELTCASDVRDSRGRHEGRSLGRHSRCTMTLGVFKRRARVELQRRKSIRVREGHSSPALAALGP